MSQWNFDYDNGLFLYVPETEIDSFTLSAFYKISLKRYVGSIEGNIIRFKPSLTYLDYKKIISLCLKKQSDIIVSEAISSYIDQKEIYIDKRSRLGTEIKSKDEKLTEKFNSYADVVNEAMVRPLRHQQMWDSFFMCAMQKSANFSVPGSGKTASVLGVYAYLKSKEIVKRIVVVCPKNAFGSWIDEFKACFSSKDKLNVFNIHCDNYRTSRERRMGLLYESGNANLILVNYESVAGVEDALINIIKENTLLVFDEVHKVKSVGGEYASHSLKLAESASYVIAMTGTPIPNSYLDVYNLLHILFPDEYDVFFDFSVPMLRNPSPSEVEAVNNKMQPFFCRTTKNQLGVPAANEDTVYMSSASLDEDRLMQILKMKYRNNKLALLVRLMQLESDPRMLLRSMDIAEFAYLLDDSVETAQIDYADYSDEVKKLIENAGKSTKFKECINLTEKLTNEGKTVVIWCIFVDSIKRIARELENLGIKTCCIFGEVPLEERQNLIDDFKNGEIQVLITNPHTLAESVSLHSVCHDAIYFEYSYNLVHLLQSKDRIHRLGLPDGQYTQYHFMELMYHAEDGDWSLDEAVYNRLKEKEQIMYDAIENHSLEIMPTSDEDLELVFRKLL